MRPNGIHFIKYIIATQGILEPIYEFGSLQPMGQEIEANLRPLFTGYKFIGTDMERGNGVDEIQDIENITLADNSVGMVICIDTLEHTQNFYKAVSEMHRILIPNGIFVFASVMNFQIHNFPNDYWRFTPSGFNHLLLPFPIHQVWFDGDPTHPQGVYGCGRKAKQK